MYLGLHKVYMAVYKMYIGVHKLDMEVYSCK